MATLQPRNTPCGTCPYRKDCPSGIWDVTEYQKLADYDLETWQQPPAVFMCHDARDGETVCRGWLDTHNKYHLLALRLAAVHQLDISIMDLLPSGTPVFESGRAAALHGMRDIDSPSDAAVRMIDKIQSRIDEREIVAHPKLAVGLSDTAARLLKEMFESGDSQLYGVAEILNMIAENGDDMETDGHLLCCAEEIRNAANMFIEQLTPHAEEKPVDAETVWDVLIMVDVDVPIDELKTWPQDWLEKAADWAMSLHLLANDNDDVVVPECPYYVHPSNTDKRLAFTDAGKEPRPSMLGTNTWMANVDGKVVAKVVLPDIFKTVDAKRFLYFLHKDKLEGKEWNV